MSKARKDWNTYPDRPLSMVFVQYPPKAGDPTSGLGRSVWIENKTANHLIQSLKKPAKRAAGTRPAYVVRCKPREKPACPTTDNSTSTPASPSRSENGCTG